MPSTETAQMVQALICSHALVRGQQRGIKQSNRDIVFSYGDREENAGGGLYRLSISSRQMKLLLERHIIELVPPVWTVWQRS
jgi:hypothetical protein